jgi:hypothetical protein
MAHYKDLDNQVHYLEDDAFSHLLPNGSVLISDDEANGIRNYVSEQQAAEAKRQEALAYLSQTDYMMTADYDKDTTAVKVLRAEARKIVRGEA